MPVNLNQTNIGLDDPNFQTVFANLQGNILKGHGRDAARHIFFSLGSDEAANRRWIRQLAETVTSMSEQDRQHQAFKQQGKADHLFVNLMLSATGYRHLGVAQTQWPDDPAFLAGMKDLTQRYDTAPRGDHKPTANPLNDDLSQWEASFTQSIDGMVIFALSGDPATVDQSLDQQVQALKQSLDGIGQIVVVQRGHVMRNDKQQVIEHFGFVDGVSNPKFLFSELNEEYRNGGYSQNDPSAPLSLVMVPDPGGDKSSFGTYVVYRKLQQNIKGFWQRADLLANTLSEKTDQKVSPEFAGALCVGRFKDGTPISEQAGDGWTNLFNNFNFDQDADGLRCPFHAHVRKTNPRGDTVRQFNSPPTIERSRRIVRRGISFGDAELNPATEWTDAGLLFLSFQASIVDQFIFMQHTWCNNENFLRGDVGLDPLVGQLPSGQTPASQTWSTGWGSPTADKVSFSFSGFVRTKGGEYFFMPSLHFLKNLPA
ncbi:Dyp-type peroxidase [Photobacterium sp. GJ3]|uniref:Dyp-type peroxidase n=1 Tax=Photobacterium sp. GJ3 TaxID=2829502 RepID=UPI001B8B6B93|nr:Dyp-type peroxidase [Photobacterium sp. GJ3]QUJ68015.1 Dyp-type peroxidase [Photobacterium sp. GJ3]